MSALDGLTIGAGSALFSTRKLRSAYGGSALRVVDSSNANGTDIGFSGEDFNTTALTSFIGSFGAASVTTWYDQSGNGLNATQALVVNMPVITVANMPTAPANSGKTGLRWNGAARLDTTMLCKPTSSTMLFNSVVSVDSQDSNNDNLGLGSTITNGVSIELATGTPSTIRMLLIATAANTSTGTLSFATNHIVECQYNDTTCNFWIDKINAGTPGNSTALSGTAIVTIGNNSNVSALKGYLGEVLIFNAGTLSAPDQGTLETNQTAYWLTAPSSPVTLMGAISL